MSSGKYRHIVVEGPIGVGKTSLARRLAAHFGAHLVLEKPQDNPFLERFYRDPARHALATQLFFLFQRIDALRELAQPDLFRGVTVSDYLFDKDRLFARLTLSDEEYALYQTIYQGLAPQAPVPDLVICLQASPAVLMERVARRGIHYERNIGEEYLARLARIYNDYFHQYDAAPLLVVNSEHLDFVHNAADFELLLARMARMKGRREYFNVGE